MIDNTALLSELYSIQESYSVEQTAINQTDKRCVIDVKERTINIPIEIESLGVQYDHRSYKLLFEIDRYVHGVDLLTQTCVIQWLSKNGTTERSGLHPVVEIEAIDNDKLLFVWELYEDETRIPGVILFAVNFYTMKDENSFLWSYNTLPAQSIIQDTLDVVINPSDEITPSLLMVWNDKMTSIEKLARDSVSTSSRSAHEAEAWAHGRTDFPNTMLDNAKYYKDLTQALYDEAKDALSEEKDRVVEEAKDEIVNLAKDEVIAVVKNEVTDDVINDVYAAKNDSIAAINDTTTSAIQEVEQSKNNAINDLFATGDQRYAVKGSIPTKVSELENDRNYLTEVPDAPVKSVNGKTGDVDLSAEDVGAVTYEEFTEFKVDYDNHTHTAADVGAATSEEVTQLKSDLNDEVIARQNAVAMETAERKAEIAVERERINQFTALEKGSTTGDAELNDARIDKDGILHANVGEHIRTVTSELDDSLKFLHDGVLSWENGDLNSSTGLELLNTSFDRTSYLPYHMLDNCLIRNTGTRELYAYCYTLNKTYIGFIKILDFPSRLIALDNTSYIRFLCRNDSTNLFKFEFPTVKSNDENIMDINSKLPNLPYVKTKKGKNLFNKADVTNGYLSGVTGGINNSDTYNTSDFIEVKSCEPITISPSFRKFLAYAVDKVPISNSFVDESTQNYVFTPEKDGYIRFSYYKSNDDITQVEYGTTPTSYEPYSDDLYFENGVKLSESMKNEVVGMIGNILSGKTLFCFGDSIMAGDGNSGVGIGDIIGSKNNMNIHDYSKGGATITWENGVSEPRTNIISQVTEAIATGVTPDYIIFDGMTNDINGGLVKTLGTIAERYSSEFDIYTFSGAFEHILKIMRNAFPSTKILYIRPHNMGSRNYDNQILYGNRALEICEKWSIPTCNLYKESGLNTFLESMAQFTKPSTSKPNGDETHPTQIGYELFYIPQITAKLKTL